MLQPLQEAPPPAPAPRCPASPARRHLAPRLRALFLRHFRDCRDVRQASKLAGVARSTLYRWREKDARFRARWETYDEMRRHEAEDYLVHLMHEGEKTTAFHRGEPVGWKVSFTVRPAVALLASQDRREKLRLREREWEAKRALVSHSGDHFPAESRERSPAPQPESPPESSRSRPVAPAAKAEKPVSVSHSEGRVHAEKRDASRAWFEQAPRKPPLVAHVPHMLQDDWRLPKATGGRGIESLLLPRFGGGAPEGGGGGTPQYCGSPISDRRISDISSGARPLRRSAPPGGYGRIGHSRDPKRGRRSIPDSLIWTSMVQSVPETP